MIAFQPLKLRPLTPVRPLAQAHPHAELGAISTMGVADWLYMGGGAVVAGVGLTSVYGGVTGRRPDFIGIMLGGVLATVGVALVGNGVKKLAS